MGLNTTLRFPPFIHDKRFIDMKTSLGQKTVFGEQSVLALDGYSIGLPVLISAVSMYAHHIGIQQVVYAAIAVSQKSIKALGFHTRVCGEVDVNSFPKRERHLYAHWLKHKPLTCMLSTSNAPCIYTSQMKRFARKITTGKRFTYDTSLEFQR